MRAMLISSNCIQTVVCIPSTVLVSSKETYSAYLHCHTPYNSISLMQKAANTLWVQTYGNDGLQKHKM